MIDTTEDARANVAKMLAIFDPPTVADIIVAHSQSDFVPGGYARYLNLAAYREALAA